MSHFQKDPVLFAYHIGDLDDFYFKDCHWPALENYSGKIEEAVLIYNGLKMPTALAFGIGERFNLFLDELLPELPRSFYCHYLEDGGGILRKEYHDEPLGTHLKMKLDSDAFKSYLDTDFDIRRLSGEYKGKADRFYAESYPDNYFDRRMLETGKYFGCFIDNKIVSISGIHVHSGEYNISVLGNITTLPDYRGRGIATAVTARLVEELVREGNMIALNVKKDNYPAIKCYENLGFVKHCEYEESFFTRIDT